MQASPTPHPLDPGYYDEHDLARFGIKAVGRDVRIARNATVIGLDRVEIGDHVRIDGPTTIVAAGGWFRLGSHIHIGAGCYFAAGAGIELEDFCGVSQGSRLYSRNDDYSGEHLTGPTVPARYLGTASGPVRLGRHVVVGTGCVVLPGVTIGEGSTVGALSLVSKSLDDWGVHVGVPARRLKDRSRRLLALEAELARDEAAQR